VVVVAEVLAAQADAAAAVAVGENVAAEVALGLVFVVLGVDDFVLHDWVSLPVIWCKVFKAKDLSPDFGSVLTRTLPGLRDQSFAVKCEDPAFGRALFLKFLGQRRFVFVFLLLFY
jgi:hypothetical protein